MRTEDIHQILRAYAAGDAFGVAYEFAEISSEVDPNCLLGKAGWPFGGVSDDTLLTLFTIESLNEHDAIGAATKFLEKLRASISTVRGLGPTTRAALGLPLKDFELSQVGISNGAMMRTALLGLAFNSDDGLQRRKYVSTLARATHRSDTAVGASLICSALFADARKYGEKNNVFDVASNEAQLIGLPGELSSWDSPKSSGISNESIDSLNAVLWTVRVSKNARDALRNACQLGGDTDTVAALATALIVARKGSDADFDSIPWLQSIDWKEIPQLKSAAHIIQDFYHRSGTLG